MFLSMAAPRHLPLQRFTSLVAFEQKSSESNSGKGRLDLSKPSNAIHLPAHLRFPVSGVELIDTVQHAVAVVHDTSPI